MKHEDPSGYTFALLELPPQNKSVFFIVQRSLYYNEPSKLRTPEWEATTKQLYEEQYGPRSIIYDLTAIVHEGNIDKHGLFKYIREVEDSKWGMTYSLNHQAFLKVFPEVLE